MYDNIEKIIEISAYNECHVDENDEFKTRYSTDIVNDYLANGWKLLTINSTPNDDHTSNVKSYILGYPKSNPTE